ncbi:MAG TPA: hypothetical protein VKC60_00320 [Opitutaceae bacterium]|nr:hypothetical protein [Opitutaceae bacterium]
METASDTVQTWVWDDANEAHLYGTTMRGAAVFKSGDAWAANVSYKGQADLLGMFDPFSTLEAAKEAALKKLDEFQQTYGP